MNPDDLLLHAGLDGELSLEKSLELERRLSDDPAFRAAWQHQQALRGAIRSHAAHHEAPAALRSVLLREVDARPAVAVAPPATSPRAAAPARRLPRREWLFSAGSALAASVLTFGVLRWEGIDPAQRLAEDAVAGHARALLSGRLVDVESSNHHTVKPWLASHLAFGAPVPDLSAHGFELLGARRDLLDGQTVAALVYRRRDHVICAYVQPRSGERAAALRAVRGFNVIDLIHAGAAWSIVSDLNAKELGDFAELVRQG